MQRIFDIILSGIALFALSPLIMLVIIVLRFTGEGEIFFFQDRIGLRGKPFRLIKFATMLKNSPYIGTGTVTISKDPRILPLGGFLRNTKINELPQLINIFKGDMSLIGPRPQTQRCFDAFPEIAKKYILKVRPGLSGVGSIIFRDEEEMMSSKNQAELFYDEVLMPYKGQLETWYVKNYSMVTYFLLIWITIVILFSRSSHIIFQFFPTIPIIPESLRPHFFDEDHE